jgi:hypothetical protein
VASDTRKRLKESHWDLLYQKVRACAQKDDDNDAATKLWEQAGDIPRGLDEGALLVYWEQGAVNDNGDTPRDICIAMEVLADIESPKSDKQARMAFQVQRLAEGMGKQRENPRTTLVRLVNEFIACRPSAEWAERFCGVARQVSI